MSVLALLEDLRRRDIHVWADGERLRCNAPAGAMTPQLRDQLRQRKHALLEFLRSAGTLTRQPRAIVPLEPRGTRTPIFGVAGHNGDVFCYRALAHHLGDDQPFYGLQPPGLDDGSEPLTRIEDIAAYFAQQMRALRASGPCIIAGYCTGGMIAFELGRQLLREGMQVGLLALFGAPYPTRYRRLPLLQDRLEQRAQGLAQHVGALAARPPRDWPGYIAAWRRDRAARRAADCANERDPLIRRRVKLEDATVAAARGYAPAPFHGRACLYLPGRDWVRTRNQPLRWRSLVQSPEEYYGPVGCDSNNMLREPYAAQFAELLRRAAAQ